MPDDPEFLTINAAAEALGTTRRRVWVMVKAGQLDAIQNPIDRREKLIARKQIENLLRFTNKSRG